jgi:hypothetical protein
LLLLAVSYPAAARDTASAGNDALTDDDDQARERNSKC